MNYFTGFSGYRVDFTKMPNKTYLLQWDIETRMKGEYSSQGFQQETKGRSKRQTASRSSTHK
jgi:hypothetical protein